MIDAWSCERVTISLSRASFKSRCAPLCTPTDLCSLGCVFLFLLFVRYAVCEQFVVDQEGDPGEEIGAAAAGSFVVLITLLLLAFSTVSLMHDM